MSKLHMEPDLLRDLARRLDRGAVEVDMKAGQLRSAHARLSNSWQGARSSSFLHEFHQVIRRLESLSYQLQYLALRVAHEVDEWEIKEASFAGGSLRPPALLRTYDYRNHWHSFLDPWPPRSQLWPAIWPPRYINPLLWPPVAPIWPWPRYRWPWFPWPIPLPWPGLIPWLPRPLPFPRPLPIPWWPRFPLIWPIYWWLRFIQIPRPPFILAWQTATAR